MATSEKSDITTSEQMKPYHSPVLTSYGLMTKETQTTATSGIEDDSGAYPFSYAAGPS